MDFSRNFFTSDLNTIKDRVSRNVLLQTDHGMMIVSRFDNCEGTGHSQWLLDHGNSNTIEAHACMSAITKPNPVIFDIGANIGTFSTWFARTYPRGQIYSFEPQPQVFNMLCGNMALNNYYNVRAFPYGLGSQEQRINAYEPDYYSPQDFGTFSLLGAKLPITDRRFVVEVKTLDWFVEYYNIYEVDLLKIDVEGMDLEVLQGGIATITKHLPAIYIEHSDNIRSIYEDIIDFLTPLGYRFERQGNNILCQQ